MTAVARDKFFWSQKEHLPRKISLRPKFYAQTSIGATRKFCNVFKLQMYSDRACALHFWPPWVDRRSSCGINTLRAPKCTRCACPEHVSRDIHTDVLMHTWWIASMWIIRRSRPMPHKARAVHGLCTCDATVVHKSHTIQASQRPRISPALAPTTLDATTGWFTCQQPTYTYAWPRQCWYHLLTCWKHAQQVHFPGHSQCVRATAALLVCWPQLAVQRAYTVWKYV